MRKLKFYTVNKISLTESQAEMLASFCEHPFYSASEDEIKEVFGIHGLKTVRALESKGMVIKVTSGSYKVSVNGLRWIGSSNLKVTNV